MHLNKSSLPHLFSHGGVKNGVCLSFGWIGNRGIHPGYHHGWQTPFRLRFARLLALHQQGLLLPSFPGRVTPNRSR